MKNTIDDSILNDLVTGYLPHSIYAFETNTHPNYLKIGDTNRRVSDRIKEWRRIYKNLKFMYESDAMISNNHSNEIVFFRDYAVHNFMINEKKYQRLSKNRNEREFFGNASIEDIREAIVDIKDNYNVSDKYKYYLVGKNNSQKKFTWIRNQDYAPRPNQQEVIDNIKTAVLSGRNNLLLYAVMRYGKSNVAIWSAKELNSKITVIVSAKADVSSEWKKTVESHIDFENFIFVTTKDFNENFINRYQNKNFVVFVTLQDLAGSIKEIKEKHTILFRLEIDLLIVDESHFGARAEVYKQSIEKKEDNDFDEITSSDMHNVINNINVLKYKTKLHLSGTPYRILLSNEFEKEDIVGNIQFSDILEVKKQWSCEDLIREEEMPWENPYFGFPEMIRFAFTPGEKSIKLLESLKANGYSGELNELFAPESTAKKFASTTKFLHEDHVLNLLKAIDGSEVDSSIFPFLDNEKIKEGKLASHMVFVLPYKNSVDALERLILENLSQFKNLKNYKIINVAGNTSNFKNIETVKRTITELANQNKKTITLTVNKLLTGSTIPEWDTMVFLKDTKSAQEYDQAIFRLQSPWIKNIYDIKSGKIIGKEDMKPQTLLIDFSPSRIFSIESERAIIHNAFHNLKGNNHQITWLSKNIKFSPIIYLNKNKLQEVTPIDIISKIRDFNKDKSIVDEVNELPVDESLYENELFIQEIYKQSELGSNNGFETRSSEGEKEVEYEIEEKPNKNVDEKEESDEKSREEQSNLKIPTIKQMRMYYARILFYSYLSSQNEKNLEDILTSYDENIRISKNLDIKKEILSILIKNMNPFILTQIDNKIENINQLQKEYGKESFSIIINKFGRISENEVFTPIKITRNMVNFLVDEKFIKDYKEKPKSIIDVASKSGVFLIEIYKKLLENGISHEVLRENLYAIVPSPVSYEFTRKVYETFDWNINNLSKTDILNSYNFAVQNFDKKLLEEAVGKMEFDVVIGNPPYQQKAKGTSSSDDPIYHHFMENSYHIAPEVLFITPARFLFNAGKTPSKWNNKMLNDKHLELKLYESDTKKIFPNTEIPGGVAVTYRNTKREIDPITTFIPYKELENIKDKVWKKEKISLSSIIYTQNKFNLENLYKDFPKYKDIIGSNGKDKRFRQIIMERLNVFTVKRNSEEDLRILGLIKKHRSYRYINKKYVESTPWINKYKVFVPFSNGASGTIGDSPARIISTPEIGLIGDGMTQTFIGIGMFDSKNEAENLLKYIHTKFVRVLLGILKVTQGNKAETWKYVPMQDFSKTSDIDWSLSIKEIDDALFNKYSLTEEEIKFIHSKITYL